MTPAHRIWDATPAPGHSFDETPMASRTSGAETPHHSGASSNKRYRWDEVVSTRTQSFFLHVIQLNIMFFCLLLYLDSTH